VACCLYASLKWQVRLSSTCQGIHPTVTMSLPNFLLPTPYKCCRALSRTRFFLKSSSYRVSKFVTHRANVNRQSPLSQSLDTGRSRSSTRSDSESIGPFHLGISQQALHGGEGVKKWSELSTGGKGTFLSLLC